MRGRREIRLFVNSQNKRVICKTRRHQSIPLAGIHCSFPHCTAKWIVVRTRGCLLDPALSASKGNCVSLHDGPPFARAPTGPCHRVFDLTVVASAMSLATATAPVALGGARATLRGRRLAHTGGSDKVIQKAPAVKPRRRGTVTRASAVGTNLTTWLLRQEMEHKIDGELAVVLSSVSIACKRVRARYRAINWPPFHLANP